MFKITIDNEEVITDKDFTIEEEMLNTPSVILNNVYPRSWEQDKDYLNFYHPNEYSKCKIYDEEIIPASEGLTVEGTSFQINYDDTKEFNLLSLKGDTSQSGTPTPTAPIPVNTVSGRQDISVVGKNLYNGEITETNKRLSTSTGGSYATTGWSISSYVPVQPNTTYTISTGDRIFCDEYNSSKTFVIGHAQSRGITTPITITTKSTTYYLRFDFPTGNESISMVEKGSSATTYEAYKGTTYEVNLGKNLFDKDAGNILNAYFNASTTTITNNGANRMIYVPCEPNTTYVISKIRSAQFNIGYTTELPAENVQVYGINTTPTFYNNNTWYYFTITTGNNAKYLVSRIYQTAQDTTITLDEVLNTIQVEKGTQPTSYAEYKTPIELCKIGNYQDYIFKNTPDSDYYDNTLEEGAWYLHKAINKVVLNGDFISAGVSNVFYSTAITDYATSNNIPYSNYYSGVSNVSGGSNMGSQANNTVAFINQSGLTTPRFYIKDTRYSNQNDLNTWLSTHPLDAYYVLATPTTELIEDTELLGQLEEINLLNGLNNISVSSPYLLTPIKIHYNFNEEIINQDLYFCGVVKNSGNISLNPREPHFQSLQVLSYKTFLSEGETLDFVIYEKTIREAIEQVVGAISDYGFIVGNINILNPDEIIGAYSTKDKSAYDVFQYIADITQSRWTTRMIDEDTIAIDFYDPSLMQLGTTIDYTKEFFSENLIDDMTYSYGTNDYRNKQVMTSQEVYSNITQTQNVIANGYQTQFNVEQQIGKINSIKIGGTNYSFATNTEKEMGVIADFYYSAGNNYFESASTISVGTVIVIDYLPIVEGRQIITNSNEIDRVANSTGVKGVVARYENRNDATTSTELQLIGQSYIKYKGVPEIVLTITTRKDLWNVGQRVQFNAPINELATLYMVRKKSIHRITTIDTIFYTYELVSSFNSETAINYFDNQRAKANGNIGEGEYISRNIDIQSNANIIFYDTQTNEITYTGDNTLNATLDAPFVS